MFPVGGYSFGFLQTGAGGGGGGTVLSVTGNIVDNTDPNNPVVTQIFEVFTEIIAQTGGTNDFTFSDTNLVTYRINAVYRFAATSLNISLDTAVRVKANALAFITLKDQDGSTDLPVSYFQQGKYYDFIYNGTNFVLVTTINEAIPVTYAGAQTLISGNNLIPNIDYLITNKADVGIKLRAETNNYFELEGSGGYMNADYQSVGNYSSVAGFSAQLGVWTAALVPVVGDVVIYIGTHYKNNTGVNTGTPPSGDAVNWTALAKSTVLNNGYITEWDDIKYNFTGDVINQRCDKRFNVINHSSSSAIFLFQWGNDSVTYNTVDGSNAYLLCINNRGIIRNNVVGGQNSHIDATSNSGTISSNNLLNSSVLTATTNSGLIFGNCLDTGGQITATLNSGNIVNNSIRNNSHIYATSNEGSVSVNNLNSEAAILVETATSTSLITCNTLFGSSTNLRATTNSGDIEDCVFISINIYANLSVGVSLNGCSFDGVEAATIDLSSIAVTTQFKSYVYGVQSTFECTVDITGLTDIDVTALNNYCGIINVISSNAIENISTITNLPIVPYTIYPANGLTITFIGATFPPAATEIYLPETTIDVDGTQRYWIQFESDRGGVGYSAYIYSLPPLSSGGGGGGGGSTPLYFVDASTTGVLANTPAYNNGTGGVGATLTAGSNGALPTQDGVSLVVGDRLLVQNQVAALQNGIYEVTDLGSGGTPYILTRVVDYDTTGEVYPSQVNVQNGTLYSGRYFLQQTVNPVIGTNSIVYLVSPTPASGTGRVVPADTVTTEILPNVPAYTNGTAGVGARLTATVNGAFPTINGLAPFLNMRVLVTSQAAALQNGIYRLAIIGSGSSVWRLVRTTDADASNEMYPSSVVIWGGYYNNTIWQQKSKAPTIGTTSIVYTLETVVSLSYTEAQTLITNSKVVVGQQYLINDLAAGDGGTNGLGVLLVGVDENNYSIVGNGGFLNPDFANNGNDVSADANYAGVFGVTGVNPATNLGIWSIQKTVAYINGTQTGTFTIGENLSSTLGVGVAGVVVDNTNDGYVVVSSPNAGLLNGGDISGDTSGATITAATYTAVEYVNGDIVFWNGLHYQIIDVSLFDTDNPSVNVTAYQVLPKNVANVGYVTAWDAIEFDFTNELIIKRSDKLGNVYLCSYVAGVALGMPYVFGVNTDFTETMQWGNTFCYSNIINESFVSVLNQSSFYKNTITDYSFVLGNDQVIPIYNNFVSKTSYLTYNTNGGSIYFTIGSPSILDNKIFLNSTISSNVFSGGAISTNEVSASSSISYNILDDKAGINANYLTIGSTIDNNTVGYLSAIDQNKITNSSVIYSNVLGHLCQIQYNIISVSSLIVANDMAESTYIKNNVVANLSEINANIMSEVGGLYVIYNNNLNFSSTISANTMDAGSKIYNNELIEQSVINNNDCSGGLIIFLNKLNNHSFIQFSVVGGSPGTCSIELNTLEDNSVIDTNTFSIGSAISHNRANSGASIYSNKLGDACTIIGNIMNTSCSISGNTTEDSDCTINYNTMNYGCLIDTNMMGSGLGGDAHINNNTMLNTASITDNTMEFKSLILNNILEDDAVITTNLVRTTSFIRLNHLFASSQITLNDIKGGSGGMVGNILEYSVVFSNNGIQTGTTFLYNIIASQCNLSNKTIGADITENYFGIICDQTESWTSKIHNKRCESGFSNFEATISITGATTLAITTVFPYVGIFNLTSANATETINTITNFPTLCPFKLLPASGLIVTFTGTTIVGIAANKIALPTASFVANGSKTGWIVLQASSAHVEQVNAMNYI